MVLVAGGIKSHQGRFGGALLPLGSSLENRKRENGVMQAEGIHPQAAEDLHRNTGSFL